MTTLLTFSIGKLTQKVLIDSQIKNARNIALTKEQVEYIRTGVKDARREDI